jgi:hypothetical protein
LASPQNSTEPLVAAAEGLARSVGAPFGVTAGLGTLRDRLGEGLRLGQGLREGFRISEGFGKSLGGGKDRDEEEGEEEQKEVLEAGVHRLKVLESWLWFET